MTIKFKTIGLIGRQRCHGSSDTVSTLIDYLQQRKHDVVVEANTAACQDRKMPKVVERDELGKHSDLVIVVGGDGSLLTAARAVVDSQTPLLGINRGHLGFLTDIHPFELEPKVGHVLDGQYVEEQRFMLSAHIEYENQCIGGGDVLNDVVLLPGKVAHMIEFAIYIDDELVCNHRADGLIIATPTGSTAYSLSGGGPILHPQLDAVVLVPMFPHTLSSRPIVVASDSKIKIVIGDGCEAAPTVSCDGHARVAVDSGGSIHVRQKSKKLRLIHPLDYNYFETLRAKLHWESKPRT